MWCTKAVVHMSIYGNWHDNPAIPHNREVACRLFHKRGSRVNSLHDLAMNKSRWTPIDELRCHVGTLGEYLLAVRKDGHINFNEAQIMKAKCDLCPTIEYGSVEKLTEKGWVRSVIVSPVSRTFTRCPEHRGTISSAIMDLLDGGSGEILEKNRIGTFEGGKIGDFKW